MSLPRTDMGKVHFTEPVHQVIEMLSAERAMSKKAWVEWVVERVCMREANRAIMRSDRMKRSGIEGVSRESAFSDGNEL